MTHDERRIETLKVAIRWNAAFLATRPKGSDPKTEAQLKKDRDELAALLAKQEAA